MVDAAHNLDSAEARYDVSHNSVAATALQIQTQPNFSARPDRHSSGAHKLILSLSLCEAVRALQATADTNDGSRAQHKAPAC